MNYINNPSRSEKTLKIFRFDTEVGKKIENYGSKNLSLVPMLRGVADNIQIVCMHLQQGGLVGLHQAAAPQLFVVVEGEGWVKGQENKEVHISKGEIAFWDKGEWHETTTENGLVAIVIEGENINPNQLLKEI